MSAGSNIPQQLSVVIITFNEESHIKACIDSVSAIADEILVVDSFSTDHTRKFCEEKGVRFIEHAFGGYGSQKNFGAGQATFDLIFSIDADERPDDVLVTSILQFKMNSRADVCTMNRLNNYCGKWIRHGAWYPDVKMRLYDRRKGNWTLAEVHETFNPAEDARIIHLQGNLLHFSYTSIEQHRRQAEKYSSLGASEALKSGKKSGFLKQFINPTWRFLRDYFFRLGFLDGYYGLIIAHLTAREVYLKYRKIGGWNKKLQ